MTLNLIISVFLLSFILQFIIQKLFILQNNFDEINFRSSHNVKATKTGGIAVFTTLFLISLYFYFKKIEIFDYSLLIPLSIMFTVGVYDDIYRADYKLKLFLQIVVAKIIIDQGYFFQNFDGLIGLQEIPWFLSQLLTILFFVVIVNAINFIDGIDGLATTDVIKTILIIEYFRANYNEISNLSFIIIACLIPLYYFNFKKENKVFLGDSGSLLLGTYIGILIFDVFSGSYLLIDSLKINKVLFILFAINYPIIDFFRVVIIRIVKNKSPFIADQNHLHHLLFKRKINSFLNVSIIEVISLSLFLLLIRIF